ncbi:hypothetical protein [Dactylosporangium sp. NPDC051484]|uniref:hypothetical protein n=1 Tax=Dactylosporangium sp. NPDC051484 TaxID=3154942 RepID=UPI00344B1BE2
MSSRSYAATEGSARWSGGSEASRSTAGTTPSTPTRRISPLLSHDLRHSFAFALAAEAGNDGYELRRRLGHQHAP